MKFLALMLTVCIAVNAYGQDQLVRVEGIGSTKESAKQDGFQAAIELVSGSVMLSDRETKRDKLTKNEISNHSAGYVSNYAIIDVRKSAGNVIVEMDVWVRPSNMANHHLNSGKSEQYLDGEKISDTYKSSRKERESADKFLNKILADYPTKAMDIVQENIEHQLDARRNYVLLIQYKLTWNQNYLKSLNEATNIVQTGPEYYDLSCFCYRARNQVMVVSTRPKSLFNNVDKFYLKDDEFTRLIADKLNQAPRIRARLLDENGKSIYSVCYESDTLWAEHRPGRNFVIHGAHSERDRLIFAIPYHLQSSVKNADRVELSVVSSVQCK
jgi:hypothetical protein